MPPPEVDPALVEAGVGVKHARDQQLGRGYRRSSPVNQIWRGARGWEGAGRGLIGKLIIYLFIQEKLLAAKLDFSLAHMG